MMLPHAMSLLLLGSGYGTGTGTGTGIVYWHIIDSDLTPSPPQLPRVGGVMVIAVR
jgi:hypothetical protein